jgi:translation initiation factor 3 subunit G
VAAVDASKDVKPTGGKYVPPSMRGGGTGDAMSMRDDSNCLRVTEISENARDEDIRV